MEILSLLGLWLARLLIPLTIIRIFILGINSGETPIIILFIPLTIFLLLSFLKFKIIYYIIILGIFISFFYSISYVTFPSVWSIVPNEVHFFIDNYFIKVNYFSFGIFLLQLPYIFISILLHIMLLSSTLRLNIRKIYTINKPVLAIQLNILSYIAFIIVGLFIYFNSSMERSYHNFNLITSF